MPSEDWYHRSIQELWDSFRTTEQRRHRRVEESTPGLYTISSSWVEEVEPNRTYTESVIRHYAEEHDRNYNRIRDAIERHASHQARQPIVSDRVEPVCKKINVGMKLLAEAENKIREQA